MAEKTTILDMNRFDDSNLDGLDENKRELVRRRAASLARAIVCSIRTRLKSFVAKVATFSMKRATTISMPITMWFQSVIAIRM